MSRFWLAQIVWFGTAVAGFDAAAADALRHVGSDKATGTSAAVLVEDRPLMHTTQLLPTDDAGKAVGDARAQMDRLLARMETVLKEAGSDLDQVAKLNFYVVNEEAAGALWQKLAKRFATERRPAASLVVTPLPDGALVAVDAVAVAKEEVSEVRRFPHSAVLPPGARLYVSGQAEPGTLREATRKTLASLSATLKHCGRSDVDIVELKCFLQPMLSVAEVREELEAYFGKDKVPPVSLVEWQSASPIEIELVAWGGKANEGPAEVLEFITPPGMKASPLFSRVARINRGGTIFFSDLYGAAGSSAEEQLKGPFDSLKLLLEMTGSDLKHLAKATYYVADDEVSQAHNAIRPKYYDPARPPAASKARVAGTGRPGSRYAMDMIAVPSSRGTPTSGPEHGHGISAEEAAAGWISLFDGATTLGWTDARVENGVLYGGETSVRLGHCQLRGEFTGEGTIVVGDKEIPITRAKPLTMDAKTSGTIKLGKGVGVESLAVRTLGLEPLFNGRDLGGWKMIERKPSRAGAKPVFAVEDGALRVTGGPAAVEWQGDHLGDLIVQIDVRSRAVHSNGGVFFRSQPGLFMQGYEAQLHNRCLENDPARPFKYATGGLDDRQDARRLVSRDFETFRMTIIAIGPHIATWVNGYQTIAWTDTRPAHENPRQGLRLEPGTLQLQAHDPATDYEVLDVFAGRW